MFAPSLRDTRWRASIAAREDAANHLEPNEQLDLFIVTNAYLSLKTWFNLKRGRSQKIVRARLGKFDVRQIPRRLEFNLLKNISTATRRTQPLLRPCLYTVTAMERKRKLPARGVRVESASKKRTSTPPEPRARAPSSPPAPVEEPLPRVINAGKPLPTYPLDRPQAQDLSSTEFQSVSER